MIDTTVSPTGCVNLNDCNDIGGVQFGTGSSATCVICEGCPNPSVNCNSNGTCDVCTHGLINIDGVCQEGCPLKTWYDEGSCEPCGENCLECESEIKCNVCEAGAMQIYGENSCFFECRSGQYNSWNNGPTGQEAYCKECHSTCSECHWSGNQDCLECPPEFYIESDYIYDLAEKGLSYDELTDVQRKGKCVPSCQPGKGPNYGVCEICPENCSNCLNGICRVCETGFVVGKDQFCEPDCSVISPYCTSCSEGVCKSCKAGYEWNEANESCEPVCQADTFFDQTTYSCQYCAGACESCDYYTGRCNSCYRQLVPVDGMVTVPDEFDCILESCPENCLVCDHIGDGNLWCLIPKPGFMIVESTGPADEIVQTIRLSECKTFNQYEDEEGECQECPKGCGRCNSEGCLTCPAGQMLHENEDEMMECVSECPAGTRQHGNDNPMCIPCQETCSECITSSYIIEDDDILGVLEYENCVKCADGLYAYGTGECVEECPRGWIGEDQFGWCVRCACDCEECKIDKETCTVCTHTADADSDGFCTYESSKQPIAQVIDSPNYHDTIQLTYPEGGRQFFHTADFVRMPQLPLEICYDNILYQNWNADSFKPQLEAIKERIRDLVGNEAFEYLEGQEIEEYPIGFYYTHSDETTPNIWKLYYRYADSLFGIDWTLWDA